MTEHPDEPATYQRDESAAHRLDRNYSELLQELRVAQAGVQILFAFLLSIAFQQRFTTLETYQRGIYLVTLVSAALAAVLLIAPVAVHRLLFAQHRKDEVVAFTARLAVGGLACLALAMTAAVLLIVDVVTNLTAAIAVAAALAATVIVLWAVLPVANRRRHTGS
ncbi:MAG: DUF6328 family protein [Jatrophihabitantaceae bacterium]